MFQEPMQLRIPGPVPVPPQVMEAIGRPAINHRGAAAQAMHERAVAGLQRLFGTTQDVAILTGSGTAAMEAAVANTIEPGDRVLALVGGKFGERWAEIASAFGASVEVYAYDQRGGADPAEVAARVKADPSLKAVLATYNESSTGVMNDIAAIAEACRQAAGEPPLLIVDAISILGGAPFALDEWGVDVAVAGSQKCLMLPPGLSFVAASERAWARIEQTRSSRYYFDLRAYRKSGRKHQWPYTQAVPLVRGLCVALDMIFAETLEKVFDRHRLMREMVRAGIRAMGLEPWTDDRFASPTVTSVRAPEGLDVEALRKGMRSRYGVEIAGGQGELQGKMVRIGHMGYAYPLDMIAVLAALEQGLLSAGWDLKPGAGLAAAQEVWASWR